MPNHHLGLCLCALALAATMMEATCSKDASFAEFKAWAKQHNKPYLQNNEELAHRFLIWSNNVAYIQRSSRHHAAAQHNSLTSPSSTRLGLTQHTDLTREEFRARYLGSPMAARPFTTMTARANSYSAPAAAATQISWIATAAHRLGQLLVAVLRMGLQQQQPLAQEPQPWRFENVTPPAAVDWRTTQPPVLGPIKDQHFNGTPCGSCWAFSSVSVMEIASAMATGKVVTGSEQQLIDCDTKYDHGCAGGGWLNAIQYTIKNRGLTTDTKYPYIGADGTCNRELEEEPHELKVNSWEDVPFSNETALMAAVSKTPVIVAICVGPALDDWHHYTGGVYDLPCCEKKSEVTLDHGIVVVGYGEEGGMPYWILKNSWGPAWGEGGFMRIKRFHGESGKCGLASFPAMVFRKPYPDAFTSAAEQAGVVAAA